MSNYPDDIRMFDNCPGSPFYDDGISECEHCQGDMECTDEDEYTCNECGYRVTNEPEREED